ncbi:MAG: DUF2281 domain-containing protein [Candidatus Sericytochromatia bacterium]|nr:DUF2281 domain-containing protein [Candidatus Sericytochromatia bacterium]
MGLNERIDSLPPEMQIEVADFVEYLHLKRARQNLAESAEHHRPSLLDVLNHAPGHLAFLSVAEVDAYIRAERETWGD